MKRFLLFFLFLFLTSGCFSQRMNIKQIDSLANYQDSYRTNTTKGLRIIDSAYSIAIRLKNDTILLKATYSKGMAFFYHGNYDSALQYWSKSIDLCNLTGNKKRLGDCRLNIGQVHELNGNYVKANENYQLGLQIFEQLNLQDRAANMLNVIGSLNNNLENFDIAEKYYRKALDTYERISGQNKLNRYIQLGLAVTYNNLGMIKSRNKDYKNAIDFFEMAKELFIQVPDSFYMAFVLHNLGSVHSENGEFEKAEVYFNESSLINNAIQNTRLRLMTLSARGDLMLKRNNALKALAYYQESLDLAEDIQLTSIILNNLSGISNAYKSLGDYRNSMHYFEKYFSLKDSLLTQSKYKQIMELQTMYETEKKEKIIIEKDRQLKQQIFLFTAIFFSIFFVLLILFFIYRTRMIRKRYKLENELNQSTQKALISQMNPHFIFNALNSVQLFILKNDKLSSNLFLTNFTDLIRKVLDNSQFQFISLYEELETLKSYMELEKARFAKKFDYEIIIPGHTPLHEIMIPTMMLQPLVENAIWHGFSTLEGKGKIRIEVIEQSSSTLLILIEDNGIGRKKAKELLAKNGKTRKSYGSKLVEERLQLYNKLNKLDLRFEYQDINDESGECKGTKACLYLSTNFKQK
jgi:tetratricopeptide (TPR) repeat protein